MLQLLITGIFGLLAGLGGVALQSYLQRRDKALDRDHERKKVLRDKAEEVYAELSAVLDASKSAVLHAFRDLHGTLEGPPGFSPDVNLDRLNALLWMYFPGAEQIMADHAVGIYDAAKKHSAIVAEAQVGPAVTVEERLKRVKQSNVDTAKAEQNLTIETVGKLRNFMNEEVKKLV